MLTQRRAGFLTPPTAQQQLFKLPHPLNILSLLVVAVAARTEIVMMLVVLEVVLAVFAPV
ncbi:MAG: hypothetical protein EBS91_08430 [Betaproteobacteria bacterium]|nr:hypothetical protein [Betaproteobacteria bacterium]NCA24606.1 hypothetical protein [Betaproteobacteria bacterium]